MQVLITGSNGFLGSNIICRLMTLPDITILTHNRFDNDDSLVEAIKNADAIIHLAAENRPKKKYDYIEVNVLLTKKIISILRRFSKKIPIIFTSSTQVDLDNAYGQSKIEAEKEIIQFSSSENSLAVIYRLTNVFGKWCKPNFNSVVATFCYNIANNLPITIDDPMKILNLVYVDDVVDDIVDALYVDQIGTTYRSISTQFSISLGDLAKALYSFKKGRTNLEAEALGSGITRALYATYITYLPKKDYSYKAQIHKDDRGVFVEMLKSMEFGQLSYFTSRPGITRGGHFHNSKVEKFLVVKGRARFKFCNTITGEKLEYETSSSEPQIIETIPGWAHEITNIGSDDLIAILWANEIYDPQKPDTYRYPLI